MLRIVSSERSLQKRTDYAVLPKRAISCCQSCRWVAHSFGHNEGGGFPAAHWSYLDVCGAPVVVELFALMHHHVDAFYLPRSDTAGVLDFDGPFSFELDSQFNGPSTFIFGILHPQWKTNRVEFSD